MTINLRGYVYDSVGAANSVTVEVWEHDGVAASATTTTDGNGLWSHASLDATKQWKVKIIDGTKVQWIDGRSKIQLTELDLIGFVTVDTVSEHTAANGVAVDGLAIKDGTFTVADDLLIKIGTSEDIVLLNRSTILGADTTLAGVLEGTVEAQAIAANSLMLANITNDGDLAFYVSKGGNSQMVFWADGSTGDTAVLASASASFDVYIAGTKEIDYSTGVMAFQQATGITAAGLLTVQGSTAQDITLWGGTAGTSRALLLAGTTVTGDGSANNSPSLILRAFYDSDPTAGVTSSPYTAYLVASVYAAGASPAGYCSLTVGGSTHTLFDKPASGNAILYTSGDIVAGGDVGWGETVQGGLWCCANSAAGNLSPHANFAGIFAKDVTASAELFAIDEAGNVTPLSPHDPETGEWIFTSENVKTGRKVRVNMEELVHTVEALTGKRLMYVS